MILSQPVATEYVRSNYKIPITRCLECGNILVYDRFSMKLVDFALAKSYLVPSPMGSRTLAKASL